MPSTPTATTRATSTSTGGSIATARIKAARVTRVGGCCGLAGNFGVEVGHYETSVAVAGHDLPPP